MTSAPGTKKKTAAITQRLIEDVPLWPAAAIHRGPSTVAMLNSSTSQKPMVLRSCVFGSRAGGAEIVIAPPGRSCGHGLVALANIIAVRESAAQIAHCARSVDSQPKALANLVP